VYKVIKMPSILVFTDAGERTWVVDQLPRELKQWPVGIIKCRGETFWNTSTRPTGAIRNPLDDTGKVAASWTLRTRHHAHRMLTGGQHQMPDMVVFPPGFDAACAAHCALDKARFREVDADMRRLADGDTEWFVERFHQPASPANVMAVTKMVHAEHHQQQEELGQFKATCNAFYNRHVVCVGRMATKVVKGRVQSEQVVEVPLGADAPTRLRCIHHIAATKTSNLVALPGDVLTTERARTERGWPMASKGGAQFRGLAPGSSVEKLVEMTHAGGGSSWISERALGNPVDVSFRVPLIEVVWWLFGPICCTATNGVVHTTMAGLLASGLGRDLITSHSIGMGFGTHSIGGTVTFTEADLLRIGRSSFSTRWGRLMPDRSVALRPKKMITAPAVDRGIPPCMQTTALCSLSNLRIELRRDISAIFTAIALARGVPLADVLPADLRSMLPTHFSAVSYGDLEKTFGADMKKGRVVPCTRCINRSTSKSEHRVPCVMPSVGACAKRMGRGTTSDLHLLTPASMAAGTGAAMAVQPISPHYDLPLMHDGEQVTVRRLKRKWVVIT
jgi:hypothetical protein